MSRVLSIQMAFKNMIPLLRPQTMCAILVMAYVSPVFYGMPVYGMPPSIHAQLHSAAVIPPSTQAYRTATASSRYLRASDDQYVSNAPVGGMAGHSAGDESGPLDHGHGGGMKAYVLDSDHKDFVADGRAGKFSVFDGLDIDHEAEDTQEDEGDLVFHGIHRNSKLVGSSNPGSTMKPPALDRSTGRALLDYLERDDCYRDDDFYVEYYLQGLRDRPPEDYLAFYIPTYTCIHGDYTFKFDSFLDEYLPYNAHINDSGPKPGHPTPQD